MGSMKGRVSRRHDTTHLAALAVNAAGYAATAERDYLRGAPHIKHESVRLRYARLLDTILEASGGREPSTAHVLDLGSGSGLMSMLWWKRGARVTAVDCSSNLLSLLRERASHDDAHVSAVASDAATFAARSSERFDVVTLVSTLHHVPDYMSLLRDAARLVVPGGSLLTFQDPIRYDTLPVAERLAGEGAYVAWRLTKGNYVRGICSRWRRIRGTLSESEASDYLEYHVVRNGVDANAIRSLLVPLFRDVRVLEYWSTQSRLFQRIGDRLGLKSTFAVVALDRLDGDGPYTYPTR